MSLRRRTSGNQIAGVGVTGIMRNNPIIWFVVVLGLALSACGSDSITTTTSPTTAPGDDDVILQVEDISTPISEQNLQEARHILDVGKLRWESFEPFAHIMTVGLEGITELRLEFDADGTLVSEELVLGEPDDPTMQLLPRSVDDVFAELDALIAPFETGERSVPEEGECGAHFNARFDSDWGVPEYYDALGPCDDGVGLTVSIARAAK